MVDSSEPKVRRRGGSHRVVSVAGIGLAVVALVAVGVLVGALVVPARVPASVMRQRGRFLLSQLDAKLRQQEPSPLSHPARQTTPNSGVVSLFSCEPLYFRGG